MSLEDEDLFEQIGNGSCSICKLLEEFEFNLMANLQWDVGTEQNLQVKKIIREQGFHAKNNESSGQNSSELFRLW